MTARSLSDFRSTGSGGSSRAQQGVLKFFELPDQGSSLREGERESLRQQYSAIASATAQLSRELAEYVAEVPAALPAVQAAMLVAMHLRARVKPAAVFDEDNDLELRWRDGKRALTANIGTDGSIYLWATDAAGHIPLQGPISSYAFEGDALVEQAAVFLSELSATSLI